VKARHAAAFSLALLAAMAVLAVAYGLWSKTLTVGGTVQTGDLDLNWTAKLCSEFHPWPLDANSQPWEYLRKDVGWTDATIDQSDPEILHFTVHNGYPSYAVDCEVHYKNVGTIPVNIIAATIVPGPNLTHCTLTEKKQTKTLECDQLTVEFWDGVGSQVDPEDGEAGSLLVHVEQGAKERTDYTFDVLICAAQWNENPTPQECFDAAGNSEP